MLSTNKINVLVVGGAGYIGSHMIKCLNQYGCKITVLDNLSSGHANAVLAGDMVVGDLSDGLVLDSLFSSCTFDVVMHFASSILVGESVKDPASYYRNNVTNTQNLLDVMVRYNVKKLFFHLQRRFWRAAIYSD